MKSNLFSLVENREKISNAISILKPKDIKSNNDLRYQAYLGLSHIKENLDEYSEYSIYENIDKQLLKSVIAICKADNSEYINKDDIFNLYLSIFKFFYYSEIIIRSDREKFKVPYDFLEYAEKNLMVFDLLQRNEILHAAVQSPILVARNLLHSQEAEIQRAFISEFKEIKKFKEEWNQEYTKHKKELDELSINIKKSKSEYNFVGLVDGFRQIRSKKEIEINNSYCSMLAAGFFMIFTPIAIAFLASIGDKLSSNEYYHALAWLIPGLTIELLILYFFRILLQQYKSIQAQILQIDLRVSLCQFIESYITYKSINIKEKDDALTKFESLIFSGIVADAGSIPSTFEGIEQVASILKNIGGTKN